MTIRLCELNFMHALQIISQPVQGLLTFQFLVQILQDDPDDLDDGEDEGAKSQRAGVVPAQGEGRRG